METRINSFKVDAGTSSLFEAPSLYFSHPDMKVDVTYTKDNCPFWDEMVSLEGLGCIFDTILSVTPSTDLWPS